MVPDNFFGSASSNSNMLQLVFVSLLIGVALVQVNQEQRRPVLSLFEGLQAVVIKLVNMIMLMAPLEVFALITKTITALAVDADGNTDLSQVGEILGALGFYCLAVVIGLLLHIGIVYIGLLKLLTGEGRCFFQGDRPGTVAGVFHQFQWRHPTGHHATVPRKTGNLEGDHLVRAPTGRHDQHGWHRTLSGGRCCVHRAGLLSSRGTHHRISAHDHSDRGHGFHRHCRCSRRGDHHACHHSSSSRSVRGGVALILGVDRILDMLRTTTNVTGDAAVCAIIANSEKQLNPGGIPISPVIDGPISAQAPPSEQIGGRKP